jgi:PAS domain S-box-containing protein
MTGHDAGKDPWDHLKEHIVGLGERSLRKSHYPELKARIRDLDQQRILFQSTLFAIPDGVAVIAPSGEIVQANPALCRMFGYRPDELLGCNPAVLYGPDSSVFQLEDFPATLCRHFVRSDGTTFFGETFASEIRDDQGALLGNLEVIRDLSDRLAALRQQRQLEDQLRQSQKMAAIGTLAGGIAHDFNNLLAAILGYAELAQLKLSPGIPPYREVEQILKAGNKAAELVNQILAFSRKETTKRMVLQPVPLIKEVIKLLRGTIPATITIREQIHDSGRMILANPTQVHQVVMNLCTNAFHAMEEEGGEMTVSLEAVDKQHNDHDVRQWLRISVIDTGPGIAPEIRERIFEPYFTTKPSGKGTGMGLAVVHGIVHRHGGWIEMDSILGQGTSVHVYFPQTSGTENAAPQKETAGLPGGKESVLVIDDEQMVADYLRSSLERLGYRVAVCSDGVSALAVFERDPGAFDLVITDQTMPGKTGFEVARTMLALRPDLPVILCSGFSSALSPERVAAAGIRKFMMKPVSLYDLIPTVRFLLDSR